MEDQQINEQELKFTQADVDAIIAKRLGEQRKKYPSDEELTAFNAWKGAQQTEADKLNAMTSERDAANQRLSEATQEVNRLKHERYLLSKGVSADDLEYYDFKISKAAVDGTTYEQAAEEFLKERPTQQQQIRVDMSAGLGGGNSQPTNSSLMNDLIRKAAKKQ